MSLEENEVALDAKEETETSQYSPPKEEEVAESSSERECDSPSREEISEIETAVKVKSQKENCALLKSVDGELDYEEECVTNAEDATVLSMQDVEEIELQKVSTPDEEIKDIDKDVEDEGEIDDGDDLEEGELPQNAEGAPTSPKPETTRQVCRFFSRGQCFFGNACRFLHLTSNFPSHNDKGQYHMFGMPPRYSSGYGYPGNLMGPSNSMMADRSYPYPMPMDYMGSVPPHREPSQVESAWERGLREAKELVKRANKRKEEEPDFDKKKLDMSIHVNEKNLPEYDKENDFYSRPYLKRDTHYKKSNLYDEYENEHPAREQHYENFEIRYTRDDVQRDRKARDRSRGRECLSSERERYASKEGRNKDRYNDERAFDIQMRTRAFEYVDPWRRSKTPKARQIHSRSGSYSSVSSYSGSERSSRSYSYSRSSSRSSSCGSSRSPSVTHKRKTSPRPSGADSRLSPSKGRNTSRFQMKKKPATKPIANRSPSSSRSRSVSRTPSMSRSRSYSRSISMDSVSSASSSLSHSSSASESLRNRNASMSSRKTEEKLPLEKLDSRSLSSYDRADPDREQKNTSLRGDTYSNSIDTSSNFPSFQHLLPGNETKVKSQHKQQIKLTLLNKPTTSKATSFPKKELDRSKLLPDHKADSSKADVGYSTTAKRPLSPTLSAIGSKINALTPKKSASSRRDELLKQLKAVEDAIARKRAKFC